VTLTTSDLGVICPDIASILFPVSLPKYVSVFTPSEKIEGHRDPEFQDGSYDPSHAPLRIFFYLQSKPDMIYSLQKMKLVAVSIQKSEGSEIL